MGYLFDPDNWEWLITENNFEFLVEGFLVNVQIALIALVFSLILGLALALGRLSRNKPFAFVVGLWVDVWRNLPVLLVILYVYLAMPTPWREAYEDAAPRFLPEVLQTGRVFAALLALVLYNSAVLAEIMRAGIQSLDRGQNEAAVALGLTYWQRMRLVILPQGLRRMLPATVSQLITLNKDTTLVYIIAIEEVARRGRILTGFQLLRRRAGTAAAGLHRHRPDVHRHEPRALAAVAAPGDPRARAQRHHRRADRRSRGPGRDRAHVRVRRGRPVGLTGSISSPAPWR